MNQDVFDDYLENRFQDQIDWMAGKATSNQKIYRLMQWAVILFAALTPVLIELESEAPFTSLATVTALIVTILTAGLKTFQYQENWLRYRSTCEALRSEKLSFDARIGDYESSKEPEKIFIERAEGLLAGERMHWKKTMSESGPSSKK